MKVGYDEMVQTISLDAETPSELVFLETLAAQIQSDPREQGPAGPKHKAIYVVDRITNRRLLLNNPLPRR